MIDYILYPLALIGVVGIIDVLFCYGYIGTAVSYFLFGGK